MRIAIVLAWALVAQAVDAEEYTLVNPGLSDGYGFSGTFTTDGRTGTFRTPEAIIDWRIQLETPGADGVTDESLTPSNSFLEWSLDFRDEILVIEEEAIYLDSERISVPITSGQSLRVRDNERTMRLGFFSAAATFPFSSDLQVGSVGVFDEDDSPFIGTALTSLERTLIAVREVPEPTSAYFACSLVLLLTLRRSFGSASPA